MSNTKSTKSLSKKCGLCGKKKNLIKTECCGNWICDPAAGEKGMVFLKKSSCWVKHQRSTLCAYHFNEGHEGHWKDCPECREAFDTELYVWYGTNKYNFETLENPPEYEPTKCSGCNKIIELSEDGYSISGGKYFCGRCAAEEMRKKFGK